MNQKQAEKIRRKKGNTNHSGTTCPACSPMFLCPMHKAEVPIRRIRGVRISDDHGKTWKIRALCDDCFKNLDFHIRGITEGEAGAQRCDFCGARNVLYEGKYNA